MILYSNVFWILYTVYLLFLDFLWVQFSGICSSLLQAHRRPPSPWRLCKTHRPEPESSRSPRRQRGQHQRRGWGSCQKLPGNNSHLYRWRVFILLIFIPDPWGKRSKLTSIFFQRGWFNHQLSIIVQCLKMVFFFKLWKMGQFFVAWLLLIFRKLVYLLTLLKEQHFTCFFELVSMISEFWWRDIGHSWHVWLLLVAGIRLIDYILLTKTGFWSWLELFGWHYGKTMPGRQLPETTCFRTIAS